MVDVRQWDIPPGDRTVPMQETPERIEWFAWRFELQTWPVPIPVLEVDHDG